MVPCRRYRFPRKVLQQEALDRGQTAMALQIFLVSHHGKWPLHGPMLDSPPKSCMYALVRFTLTGLAAQHMAVCNNSFSSRFWLGHPGCKAKLQLFQQQLCAWRRA